MRGGKIFSFFSFKFAGTNLRSTTGITHSQCCMLAAYLCFYFREFKSGLHTTIFACCSFPQRSKGNLQVATDTLSCGILQQAFVRR